MRSFWDRGALRAGGFSGIVTLDPGEQIRWECEVENNLVDMSLTFGRDVHTREMCNLFGIYAPSLGTTWMASAF